MATATPEPKSTSLRAWTDPSMSPLREGDRLDAVEFLRRYEASTEIKNAELIEGVVHVASPVRFTQHGNPQGAMIGWLSVYEAGTPSVSSGGEATVRLDDQNVYEPDAMLLIDSERGGRVLLNNGDIEGAPELIVEISASTADLDLSKKLECYCRHSVREYIVWRTVEKAIDWFTLRDGEYVQTSPGEDGIIRSEAFPGLWLDPAELIAGNLARVLAVVGEGVKSPEHAKFVVRLDAEIASLPDIGSS